MSCRLIPARWGGCDLTLNMLTMELLAGLGLHMPRFAAFEKTTVWFYKSRTHESSCREPA